jgi:hypothetical protein
MRRGRLGSCKRATPDGKYHVLSVAARRLWNKGQLPTVDALVDPHFPGLREPRGRELENHRSPALLAVGNRSAFATLIHAMSGHRKRTLKKLTSAGLRGSKSAAGAVRHARKTPMGTNATGSAYKCGFAGLG